jgi:hypothetical protein
MSKKSKTDERDHERHETHENARTKTGQKNLGAKRLFTGRPAVFDSGRRVFFVGFSFVFFACFVVSLFYLIAAEGRAGCFKNFVVTTLIIAD